MNFTKSWLGMQVEHFLAWWRGDLTKITDAFTTAVKKLEDHKNYVNLIADNQAQAARALQAASKAAYAEADKAMTIAANLRKLIEG